MSKTKRRRIQRDQQIQKRHRERFLAALASGSSPTRAAKQAGIGRSTLYEARSKDREFARARDDAVMEGIDCLEDEALRRATKGGSAGCWRCCCDGEGRRCMRGMRVRQARAST